MEEDPSSTLGYSGLKRSEIHVINADGTDRITLSEYGDHDDYKPVWSPDGQRIAFVSDRDENASEIYVMDADGSNQHRLTNHRADVNTTLKHYDPWTDSDFGPVWSPDGRSIVFLSRRDIGVEIYSMRSDGSDERPLTFNNFMRGEEPWITDEKQNIAWSPDGQHIAFDSDLENGPLAIYTMNADGCNQRRLTLSGHNGEPRWSPDGQQILFNSSPGDESSCTRVSMHPNCLEMIYVMDADGSNQRPLTVGEIPEWVPPLRTQADYRPLPMAPALQGDE